MVEFRFAETVIHRSRPEVGTGKVVDTAAGGLVRVLWDGWALPKWYDGSEIGHDPVSAAAWAKIRAVLNS